MASRTTKMQVNYIQDKLDAKISELCNKKLAVLTMGDSLIKIIEDVQAAKYIAWLKKQSKAMLVSAIGPNGETSTLYRGSYSVSDVTRFADSNESTNAFCRSLNVAGRIEALKMSEVAVQEYRAKLVNESVAVMDSVVMAGSADEVAKAVVAFMAKSA